MLLTPVARRLLAEMLATAALVVAVVGLSAGAQRIWPRDTSAQFLGIGVALGAVLAVLVVLAAPISGAHLNPAVTLAQAMRGKLPRSQVPAYLAAQLAGSALGVGMLHFAGAARHPAGSGGNADWPADRPSMEAAPLGLGQASARRAPFVHGGREVPEVLFVCVHNAGRSQMAAALLEWHAQGAVRVRSAGSEPTDQVNPAAVAALAELGIDISAVTPKRLDDGMARAADVVVTMGCGDACPVYPGARHLDWSLADPAGKTLDEVRPIRNEIERRVLRLLAELTGETYQP